MGAAVINSPCLGCHHQNETNEGLGWWMRAGAGADKTWPMNLFYIIGFFDHWQKFRDGPVHLSKQTKASLLHKPSLTPDCHFHLLSTQLCRLALTSKQRWNDRDGPQQKARQSNNKEIEGDMDRKRQSSCERGPKVSIKEAWSLWTIAARFKVPLPPKEALLCNDRFGR